MKLTDLERKELEKYIFEFNYSHILKNKTILITGSKGLVGSALIKWLLLQNELLDTNLHIIASTRNPEKIPDYIENSDNIEYCSCGSESQIDIKIDYIVHAASPTGNKNLMQYPVETFRTNVDGVENMLELVKNNSDCAMLYISSEEVYGVINQEAAVTENVVGAIDSLNIRSCYPLAKKASEFLCYAYAQEFGVDVKIIRPTVIQGLFQRYEEPRVVNEMLRCIVENKDLIMKSDGKTKKCMIYTLDAISAMLTVLLKGSKGEVYNASNPDTYISVRDLGNYLFNSFNPKVKAVFSSVQVNANEGFLPHREMFQDCSKLKSLGWEPKASLDHIYEVDIERFSKC